MNKTALHLNEMPLQPFDPVLEAAIAACMQGNRYPTDDGMKELQEALGVYLGVEPQWVTIANGSLMILHQIMIAAGQCAVVYGWPSFADYPVLAQGLNMRIQPVDLHEDGSSDLSKLADGITDETSLVVICSPNPPTGAIVRHDDVVDFLRHVPKNVTVLIDEAYGEFVNDKHVVRSLELARKHPNVVLARSFSKAYGLAGFRIGYAIAQPQLSAKISAAGLPRFQISSAAQAAAITALRNQPEMRRRIETIVTERHRMADTLRHLGATVVEGHGNFIWLPVGELAQHVKESLARHNILVHASMPFGVRITVGTSEDTDRLQAAWLNADPLNTI
jgi:histidinol-phosphate aminotransferase